MLSPRSIFPRAGFRTVLSRQALSGPLSLLCLIGIIAIISLEGCSGGGGTLTTSPIPTPTATATPTPTPTPAVTVSPVSVSVQAGATQTFSAVVASASDSSVVWSLQEGALGGTITTSGVYTAPATAGIYHVIATSNADTSATSTATVTVTASSASTTGSGAVTVQ